MRWIGAGGLQPTTPHESERSCEARYQVKTQNKGIEALYQYGIKTCKELHRDHLRRRASEDAAKRAAFIRSIEIGTLIGFLFYVPAALVRWSIWSPRG
jgi:hypothetical protein